MKGILLLAISVSFSMSFNTAFGQHELVELKKIVYSNLFEVYDTINLNKNKISLMMEFPFHPNEKDSATNKYGTFGELIGQKFIPFKVSISKHSSKKSKMFLSKEYHLYKWDFKFDHLISDTMHDYDKLSDSLDQLIIIEQLAFCNNEKSKLLIFSSLKRTSNSCIFYFKSFKGVLKVSIRLKKGDKINYSFLDDQFKFDVLRSFVHRLYYYSENAITKNRFYFELIEGNCR